MIDKVLEKINEIIHRFECHIKEHGTTYLVILLALIFFNMITRILI